MTTSDLGRLRGITSLGIGLIENMEMTIGDIIFAAFLAACVIVMVVCVAGMVLVFANRAANAHMDGHVDGAHNSHRLDHYEGVYRVIYGRAWDEARRMDEWVNAAAAAARQEYDDRLALYNGKEPLQRPWGNAARGVQ